MDRILQGISTTIQVELTRGGTPEDPSPDSATVVITRSDGSVVFSGAAVDIDTPAGVFAHTLTPADTALLDTLTAAWTFTFDGVAQTTTTVVEVVGGFLFTIAEAAAIRLGSATDTIGSRFSTAEIVAMRTTVEQAIEGEYGAALVPRFEHETLDGTGRAVLPLRWPLVRAVRSATVGGSAVTVSGIDVGRLGVSYSSGWTAGYGNVVVGYEHGLPRPPEILRRMGLLLAKRWLIEGPVDDRATSMSNEDGTFALSTPGRGGSIFGLPDLDRAIKASPYRIGIA